MVSFLRRIDDRAAHCHRGQEQFPFEGRLFQITFLIFLLKLLLTDYSKKEWHWIVGLELLAFFSYWVTGANELIRIVTFVAACKNIPLKQMMRYAFYVRLAAR